MIRQLDDMPEGVLGFRASGKLTADDYTHVLGPALDTASKGSGKIRVLLDFGDEFDGMQAGAVWQDLRVGVRNWSAWQRIALVTDHTWLRDGFVMFSWAVPGEARSFPASERGAAIHWLHGS